MQRRSVTDSRAEVQLVQTGRYGKKEAEALVGSVTRYPPTRHSDRRIVMDAYQVMDYKEEKEEEEGGDIGGAVVLLELFFNYIAKA